MPYRQTASISGLIWRKITVRAFETVVTRRQNKALYLQLRDPPDRIGESLREDLQGLAQSADTLAGVVTDENELERGMEDFVGQADIAEYKERMDELARETHEKMVDVRNELNKAFA